MWCEVVATELLTAGATEVGTPVKRNGRWQAPVHWPPMIGLWQRRGPAIQWVDLAQARDAIALETGAPW